MATRKKYSTKQLGDWMQGKAKTAAGIRRKIISNTERAKSSTVIGRLYFFWYDPKHKKTLPIYDRFPMVFPIERYPDGFLGLNLHYLSYGERIRLISLLSGYANNKKLSPSTRLKLSYDLLASTKSVNSLMRPCIKRYLFNHVRSSFAEVYPEEWDKAAELPTEFWVQKR